MKAVLLTAVAAMLVGCSSVGDASAGSELTVYAAASLKGALDEATAVYESADPGVALTVSTDSSAALEIQIEQGAPADVFLSADTANPQKLVDAGLADGDPVGFARNELVVVVPAGNPGGIDTPADLGRPGVRVIAAGDAVPITKYAAELVANLANEAGYPADFAAAYAANVVSREDNVNALIAKVELGEGDAGIVYLTDAVASDRVESLPLPDDVQVDVAYAGVIVAASRQQPVAQAFLEWLRGSDAQSILARYGFRPVG